MDVLTMNLRKLLLAMSLAKIHEKTLKKIIHLKLVFRKIDKLILPSNTFFGKC